MDSMISIIFLGRSLLRVTLYFSCVFICAPLSIVADLPEHGQPAEPDKKLSALYEELSTHELVGDSFHLKEIEHGIALSSKDEVKLADGSKASKVRIELQGPYVAPPGKSLKDAIAIQIDRIVKSKDLNEDFPEEDEVAEGVGATIVDVNGQNVAFIEYQIADADMPRVKRAMIFKDGKVYGFSLTLSHFSVNKRRAMLFDMLVIAAVNSGKL